MLLSTLTLLFASLPSLPSLTGLDASALEDCGTLALSQNCVVFISDQTGTSFELADYGSFAPGDRVYVTGVWGPAPGCSSSPAAVFLTNTIEALVPVQETCFCTTSGPCGNNDPAAGCRNSMGVGSTLCAIGSGSLSAQNLRFVMRPVPIGEMALVYMGSAPMGVSFGDGIRCVGGGTLGLFRFPWQTSPDSAVEQPAAIQYAQAQFPGSGGIAPGTTCWFQGYYRDMNGPCGSGHNQTQAIAIQFTL